MLQYMFSALEIVITALIGILDYTKKADEVKKNKIGKLLADFIILFDRVINNGGAILKNIDHGIENRKEIIRLIKVQIKELNEISSYVQMYFLNDLLLCNISGFDMDKHFYKKKYKLNKIFHIYGADMNPSLNIIIEHKTEILSSILELLLSYFEDEAPNNFYIYEIDNLNKEILQDQLTRYEFMHKYVNENNLIKLKKIDLMNPKDRKKYISLALKQIEFLIGERNKMSDIIVKFYQPHDIV